MKTFNQFSKEIVNFVSVNEQNITKDHPHENVRDDVDEEMDEEVLEACWDGYKQIGVKKKGTKMVPNCVPVKEEEDIIERGADSKGYYRSTESGAGLTRKGAKHFGIQTAVTGKVKRGSSAAKRRKSFCARMSGMPGPMKDEKGRPTRKAASLRRWRCPL